MTELHFKKQNSGDDWMSKLNQIREARAKFDKGQGMMSDWERQTVSESIKDDASRNYTRIFSGVKQRLDDAVGNYKTAAAKRDAAIAREINSWDAARMNNELQAFQTRVSMELGKKDVQGLFSGQPTARRIEQLYREAQASGDKYKMRAAAEVLQAADVDKLPDEQRMQVQSLAHAANKNLDDLRNSDDIKNAMDLENAAIKAMQEEIQFVKDAGAVMRDDQMLFGNPVGGFAKLASTVKFEQAGGRVNIKILELDDPELTGIDLSEVDNGEIQ